MLILLRSIIFLCLAMVAVQAVCAQDRVWLEPPRPTSAESTWYPRAIQQLSGNVVDFDADRLRFIPSGDEAEMLIAAWRVLWIDPETISPLEGEAIELYESGEYAQTLSKLPDILRQRPPVWRQQWITMLAAQASWKSGRSKIALELVSQLDRRSLPPLVVSWLPIAWVGGVSPAGAVAEATARLSDPSPAVRLVAASWLLSSAHRSRANQVLQQLSSGDRQDIKRLADVLRWRTATPPEVMQSASRWRADLNAMPMVFQTGPTKTLIDKLRSSGQSEAAEGLQWSLDLTPIHPTPD